MAALYALMQSIDRCDPVSSRKNLISHVKRSTTVSTLENPYSILLLGMPPRDVKTIPAGLFGTFADLALEVTQADLTRDRLYHAMAVLTPLVGPNFDAIDIVKLLAAGSFRGRYIAYVSGAGHTDLIEEEVRAAAPLIRFSLVNLERKLRLADERVAPAEPDAPSLAPRRRQPPDI